MNLVRTSCSLVAMSVEHVNLHVLNLQGMLCRRGNIFSYGYTESDGCFPASLAADKLGRKWIIIPNCISMASALSLMALLGMISLMDTCFLTCACPASRLSNSNAAASFTSAS